MTVYQDRLEETIKQYTESNCVISTVDTSELSETFGNLLPDAMYDFWSRVGLGVFHDGYFQICDPLNYSSIVEILFPGDKFFLPKETLPLGFSAFGKIIAWNKTYRFLDIDLVNGQIYCDCYFEPEPNIDPNINLLAGLLLADGNSYDVFDNNGKGMFKRVKAKLGELSFGQIYGFKPILALGGFRSPDALKIYDALPHMAILAQAQPMELKEVNYASPL